MTPGLAASDPGFTLIEALIALAIVAGMTAALVETTVGDARARAAVRERREALMLAQSALDAAYDPSAGDHGAWQTYGWRIGRDRVGDADAFDRHPLERLTVVVDHGGRRVMRLVTVRARP